MDLGKALQIALDFERKVRDHYQGGVDRITDAQGKKVFQALAREEQGHVDFLEHCLAEWQGSGKVAARDVATRLPSPAWVTEAAADHRRKATTRVADKGEVDLLKVAVRLEEDAGTFYRGLVAKLAQEGDRKLFEPFLAIEEGHLAIVQGELDAVQGSGFWFDVQEFSMEH
jgi:rubrerythrin